MRHCALLPRIDRRANNLDIMSRLAWNPLRVPREHQAPVQPRSLADHPIIMFMLTYFNQVTRRRRHLLKLVSKSQLAQQCAGFTDHVLFISMPFHTVIRSCFVTLLRSHCLFICFHVQTLTYVNRVPKAPIGTRIVTLED